MSRRQCTIYYINLAGQNRQQQWCLRHDGQWFTRVHSHGKIESWHKGEPPPDNAHEKQRAVQLPQD